MTMIEKIAIAIDAGFDKDGLEGAARAAVEAMRDIRIDFYMKAGNVPVSNRGDDDKPIRSGRRIGDLAALDVWCAMIDAILAEQPEKPE